MTALIAWALIFAAVVSVRLDLDRHAMVNRDFYGGVR